MGKVSKFVFGLFIIVSMSNAKAMPMVGVFGTGQFGGGIETGINDFYNSLSGVSSSQLGSLTSSSLAGIDLLWAIQPSSAYTSTELGAMSGHLAGGGRIAFMGEHGGIALDENNRINAALTALGASMSIIPGVVVDSGFRTASVGDGQILSHTLTAGVNAYEYAAFNPLDLGANGIALMLGEESLTDIMMGFEIVGPGSIFMITDQNVLNFSGSDVFDNETMFENLLLANTGAPPPSNSVPEPSSFVLFGLGMAAMGFRGRKKSIKNSVI